MATKETKAEKLAADVEEERIASMARAAHDNWSAQRFEDGWSYGEAEDSVNKTDPRLVPYEKLTAKQKEAVRSGVAAHPERAAPFPPGSVHMIHKGAERIPVRVKDQAHFDRLESEHGIGSVVLLDPQPEEQKS